MAAIGTSSVDRLARSKRPIVERTEIHIPHAPALSPEAVTGPTPNRLAAVARFNADLQKWRNDAWSVEMPGMPDFALQTDVATLRDDTAQMIKDIQANTLSITNIETEITTINNQITTIINDITTIEGNTATGTGIVQAQAGQPQDTVLGTDGHVPFWRGTKPFLSQTSPIYTDGTLVGIGTDLPAVLLDIGLAGVTGAVVRLAGASGGNVTITTAAVAGTWTWTLPTNDGAANQFMQTNGAGVTTWETVDLTTDVTGVLPTGNGGTGTAGPWTAGSVIFAGAGGTALAQDNANFFWDDTNNRLGLGDAAPDARLEILQASDVETEGLQITRSNDSNFTRLFKSAGIGTLADALIFSSDFVANHAAIGRDGSAYFAGSVGIATSSPGVLLDLGLAGTTRGVMRMAGNTSGNVTIQPAAIAGTWTLTLPVNDGNTGDFLMTDGGGITSWVSPTTVVPAALTEVDDTNVTITLGGSPTVALLAATSITLGWTGVLSIARGGTNASSFATADGVVYFDGTSLVNSANLLYSGSELISRGVSLNGVNEPYLARNINTGANAGTGYEAELADTSNNLITAGYITWNKEQSWTSVASTQDSFAAIGTTLNGVTIAALQLMSSGSVVCGKNSTDPARTDDWLYICTSAGAPSTTPITELGSRAAIGYDTTNKEIVVYDPTDNTWRSVAVL
jgi:hypothetical protein